MPGVPTLAGDGPSAAAPTASLSPAARPAARHTWVSWRPGWQVEPRTGGFRGCGLTRALFLPAVLQL